MGMGVIKISELLPVENLASGTFYVVDANGCSRKCSAADIANLAKTGVTITDNGTSDGVHTYTFSNGSTTVAIEIPDSYKKTEVYEAVKTEAHHYIVEDDTNLINAAAVFRAIFYGYSGTPGSMEPIFESTPTEGSVKAIQSGAVYTIAQRIPVAPSADGTYVLKCIVSNGTPTYQWVSQNG